MRARRLFPILLTLLATSWAAPASAESFKDACELTDNLRYDQAYWGRPHNGYQQKSKGGHWAKLTDSLDAGFRVVELDVDVAGGKLKVWHAPTGPSGNNCANGSTGSFSRCLSSIQSWSNAHPNHLPITIQLDMKTDWKKWEVEKLDRKVSEALGAKLVRPNDVRAGASSLRVRVKQQGWPTVGQLRGKILVFIMGGKWGDKNDTQEEYVRWRGTAATSFVCPNAHATKHFQYNRNANDFDDPKTNKWVVCGNTKNSGKWQKLAGAAKANNQIINIWASGNHFDSISNYWAAIRAGGAFINKDEFRTSWPIPMNGKRACTKRALRLRNPRSNKCAAISGSIKNGTRIRLAACSDNVKQVWHHGGAGQFTSLGNPLYCYDIKSGDGDKGDVHHAWRCDGGASEKWQLRWDGSIRGKKGRCIDVKGGSTASGATLHHWDCNGTGAQKWVVEPWPQAKTPKPRPKPTRRTQPTKAQPTKTEINPRHRRSTGSRPRTRPK